MNKIALITGGSRGLGKAFAIKLASKGIDVVITYLSNDREAETVVSEVEKLGRKAVALQFDVTKIKLFKNFTTRLTTELHQTFNTTKIDYLINNAGAGINASFEKTTEEQFNLMSDINFKGTYFTTQHILPLLNNGGSIVNLSSRLAFAVLPEYSAYAAMKGALITFTKYLAKELGARRIRVNAVAPGPISTDFGGGILKFDEAYRAHIASITALGRIGEVDDIAGIIAFLCSDDSRWITGQTLEASGGIGL